MSKTKNIFSTSSQIQDDTSWLPISDLMSGLMIFFLFLSVYFIFENKDHSDSLAESKRRQASLIDTLQKERERWNEISGYVYNIQNERLALYPKLLSAIEYNLNKWNAEIIDSTLVVRFNDADVLFEVNSAEVKDGFKNILREFYPLYISTLYENGVPIIDEVRIEGHTSSEWYGVDAVQAYFNNMKLSHERARAILEFCLKDNTNNLSQMKRDWAKKTLSATGYSSSRLITDGYKNEDIVKSRRVEFRVKTKAEVDLKSVIEKMKSLEKK